MSFELEAVIEIPKGSSYKYEVDKSSGRLTLDRPINQEIPFSYGFIPATLESDSDPIDIFVLSIYPIPPLTHVKVKIFGALKCKDNGFDDNKLLGVLVGEEMSWNSHETHTKTIENYLKTYKEGFQVLGFVGVDGAKELYKNAVDFYESLQKPILQEANKSWFTLPWVGK